LQNAGQKNTPASEHRLAAWEEHPGLPPQNIGQRVLKINDYCYWLGYILVIMTPEIQRFLSLHRLTPYCLPGETSDTAFSRYQWSIKLAEALLPSINYLEIGLRNVTGWEVKNWNKFTGFAGGGDKALFGVKVGYPQKDHAPLVVLAESAIDVMTYYQLHPAPGFYLSFAGTMSPEQHELLQYVLTRYPEALIIAATDNDKEGERFAELIQSIRPDAIRDSPTDAKD
jgi:Toprim-like